jgi:hypothetical protein
MVGRRRNRPRFRAEGLLALITERVWSWQIAQKDLPMGTFRVRWVIRASQARVAVESFAAYSRSSWTTAALRMELQLPAAGKQARITAYNGELLEPANREAVRTCCWDLAQARTLKVHYSKPTPRKMDRTLLRFELPETMITVAVEDVVAHGCVYVPSVGLFVTGDPQPQTLPQYLQHIAGKKTVLEQVRQRPDQRFADAMARTHNPLQNLGPTLVGLACDNRKFVVDREGRIRFDLYDAPDGDYDTQRFWELIEPEQFCPQIVPQFGAGHGSVERHLDGGWLPKPVTTVLEDGVEYRQCTYVAPLDAAAPAGYPRWYRRRALCVAEYTIANTRPTTADVGQMMDYLEDYQFLRSGWFDYPEQRNREDPFNLGGFAKVQPYYARNAEIYALRDDVKPFLRSYFKPRQQNSWVKFGSGRSPSVWYRAISMTS